MAMCPSALLWRTWPTDEQTAKMTEPDWVLNTEFIIGG